MSEALMPAVIADGISGQQAPHEGRQAGRSADQQQVDVVVQQGPGWYPGPGSQDYGPQAIDKGLPILFVLEDVLLFDAPDHDMVQGTGDI
jgi:hypothetical protein